MITESPIGLDRLATSNEVRIAMSVWFQEMSQDGAESASDVEADSASHVSQNTVTQGSKEQKDSIAQNRGSMNVPNVEFDRPFDMRIDNAIAELAYHYWEQRGQPIGSSEVDWHRAADDVSREQARHMLGLG